MSTEALHLLRSIVPAEQLSGPGMAETPGRMTRALQDLTEGYSERPEEYLKTFDAEGYDQVIVVRDVPFASLCEHHVLPFVGTVDVAYLPDHRIVGLSKIPRLVHTFARRLQVQERLTKQVADALTEHLTPRGVMVVVKGEHSCMRLRGVRSTGQMVTSDVRGVFRDDASARIECLRLLQGDR